MMLLRVARLGDGTVSPYRPDLPPGVEFVALRYTSPPPPFPPRVIVAVPNGTPLPAGAVRITRAQLVAAGVTLEQLRRYRLRNELGDDVTDS